MSEELVPKQLANELLIELRKYISSITLSSVRTLQIPFHKKTRRWDRRDGDEAIEVLLTPVRLLNLTVRTENALKNDNLIFIGQLIQMTEAGLFRLPNMGQKSLDEVIYELSTWGLRLGTDVQKEFGVRIPSNDWEDSNKVKALQKAKREALWQILENVETED